VFAIKPDTVVLMVEPLEIVAAGFHEVQLSVLFSITYPVALSILFQDNATLFAVTAPMASVGAGSWVVGGWVVVKSPVTAIAELAPAELTV
jgi:hypothetical protein